MTSMATEPPIYVVRMPVRYRVRCDLCMEFVAVDLNATEAAAAKADHLVRKHGGK